MSNLVKYRVWDNVQRRMIAVPSLHFGDDGSGKTITMMVKTDDRMLVMGENAELMQFTGLRDKDGTEVSESDIAAIWCPKCAQQQNAIISFNNGGFTYTGIDCEKHHGYFSLADSLTCTVVGNIYEYPHLLKEPQ